MTATAATHIRFADAETVRLRCPAGELRVVVADGFRLRLLGLSRLSAADTVPLLFPRCRSIHMRGMRTPIDLVWLSLEPKNARVLEVEPALAPGRYSRFRGHAAARRTVAALELSPGEAERLGLRPGAILAIS